MFHGRRTGGGGSCSSSSSPVGSRRSRHFVVGLSESGNCHPSNTRKVFQFYSTDSENRQIIKKKHTPLVFCFFGGHMSHTHLLTHTLSVQINTQLKLPLGDQGANRRRIGFILAHTHSLARTSNGTLNCFTSALRRLIP